MIELPFLCCSYLVVFQRTRVISINTLSATPSLKQSPEYIVLAKSTAPQGNFGNNLKMFGYFERDLGTGAADDTTGIGGGIAGILILFRPGSVAGTELKSQGKLEGAGASFQGVYFLTLLSFFLIFFYFFLRFSTEGELSDELLLESLQLESDTLLSFFFFFQSLSFFLSFYFFFSFSLSLRFFLSPILKRDIQILQRCALNKIKINLTKIQSFLYSIILKSQLVKIINEQSAITSIKNTPGDLDASAHLNLTVRNRQCLSSEAEFSCRQHKRNIRLAVLVNHFTNTAQFTSTQTSQLICLNSSITHCCQSSLAVTCSCIRILETKIGYSNVVNGRQ